eukprot:g3215.t1
MYKDEDIQRAEFDTANKTSMTDYAQEIYSKLYPNKPLLQELVDKKATVVKQYMSEKNATDALMTLLQDSEKVSNLRDDGNFNVEGLQEAGVENAAEAVKALYKFAKIQMDCGQYADAGDKLRFFLELSDEQSDDRLQALWGKLAADILEMHTDDALVSLLALRTAIDNRDFSSPLEQLQQRSWLIHWALFVFFSRADGPRLLCEFFFEKSNTKEEEGGRKISQASQQFPYISVIQNNCPWLFRYVSAAAIVERKANVNELVDAMRRVKNTYSDPLTLLLENVYLYCDLDKAKENLRECATVLKSDFFFSLREEDFSKEFMEASTKVIFETFCSIHQEIDMKKLAESLNVEVETIEKWMVALIRNNNMQLENAKIDSAKQMAYRTMNVPSVYENIIRKTEDLCTRAYELSNHIQNLR